MQVTNRNFRYIIFGAGAVGSTIGGFLTLAVKEVVLIGRKTHIAAINRNGLQMNSYEKTWKVQTLAFDSIEQIQPQENDIIFLTVKTNNTQDAIFELAKKFPTSTPLFSFQNSVINEEIIASVFPKTYGGVVRMTSQLFKSGIINFRRIGRLIVGKYPQGIDEIARKVTADLQEAGFDVSLSAKIMNDKWLKLALNATSIVTAIFSNPQIDGNETNKIKIGILKEIDNVLKIAKIDSVPCSKKDKTIEAMIAHFQKPARPYQPKIPVYNSTWQALVNKKPLEADYFLLPFLELAERYKISLPLTEKILKMCDYLEKRKLSPTYYQPNDVKKLQAKL